LERMGGGEEFSLRLLGHLAGILPSPCSRVLHGLATVGLTLQIGSGHSIRIKEAALRSRLLYLDVIRLQSA
jgi:DNA-binding IclR family transcriptional regulator